jgi:DNA processing protein
MEITRLLPDQYPFLLKQIQKQPKYLDLIGKLPPDDCKFLCVVGSRSSSNYGKNVCRKLIAGLEGYPVVIVSGLAIGIDSIAHEAALEAGLTTIAFPGSGLNEEVIYPRVHLPLAKKIVAAGGALLSPFERDQIGQPWCFPVRNSLMAGISQATLIIEGGPESGTLITARETLEFSRDLLFVPGQIFSELSHVANYFLRHEGKPITSSADLLEELGFKLPERTIESEEPNPIPLLLSPDEEMIVSLIRRESLTIDELLEKTGYAVNKFSILISELELRGIIREEGGVYKI